MEDDAVKSTARIYTRQPDGASSRRIQNSGEQSVGCWIEHVSALHAWLPYAARSTSCNTCIKTGSVWWRSLIIYSGKLSCPFNVLTEYSRDEISASLPRVTIFQTFVAFDLDRVTHYHLSTRERSRYIEPGMGPAVAHHATLGFTSICYLFHQA